APLLVATALVAGAAHAQDTSAAPRADASRRAAITALPAGALVRVHDADPRVRWTRGTIVRVQHDTLHLRDSWRGRPVAVPLAAIARVEVQGKGKQGAGIAVGALVGAVLGAATTAMEAKSGGVVLVGALVNGLLGAGIGALATRKRWVPLWPADSVASTR
ncbi:MAG: hypothetical protein ACXWZS_18370, partial [Gemmatirosa sp.]